MSIIQTLKGKDRDFDETTFLKLQTALGVAALDRCSSSAATKPWPCLVACENRVSPVFPTVPSGRQGPGVL